MSGKRFYMVLACLTALCCAVTAIVNFAGMPGLESTADLSISSAAVFAASSGASADTAASDIEISFAQSADTGQSLSASQNTAASVSVSQKKNVSASTASSKTSRFSSQSGKTASLSGPVNVNTADAATLDLLPGIGDVIAQRIIAYRTANGAFHSLSDLQKVKGIGEKKAAALTGKVVF